MHHRHTAALLLAALLLGGCAKADVAVFVGADGTGAVRAALGLPSASRRMIAESTEGDPLDALQRGDGPFGKGPARRWTDGDVEWVERSATFASPDELGPLLAATSLFEQAQLTRRPGLFADTLVLDAVASPMAPDQAAATRAADDEPGLTIEARVSVRMPGRVTESTGSPDPTDRSRQVWVLSPNQATAIHVASEVVDLRRAAALAGAALLALLAAGALVVGVVRRRAP